METHYKALVVRGGHLRSYYAQGYFGITYKKDEWVAVKPTALLCGYGLCVFDTYGDAEGYVLDEDDVQIWECETQNELPLPAMLLYTGGTFDSDAFHAGFWKTRLKLDRAYDPVLAKNNLIGEWPIGTLMFEKVKITRRVR